MAVGPGDAKQLVRLPEIQSEELCHCKGAVNTFSIGLKFHNPHFTVGKVCLCICPCLGVQMCLCVSDNVATTQKQQQLPDGEQSECPQRSIFSLGKAPPIPPSLLAE